MSSSGAPPERILQTAATSRHTHDPRKRSNTHVEPPFRPEHRACPKAPKERGFLSKIVDCPPSPGDEFRRPGPHSQGRPQLGRTGQQRQGAAKMRFALSMVWFFVWRQNYNHSISDMAAFFTLHARTFFPALPLHALLLQSRTGSWLPHTPGRALLPKAPNTAPGSRSPFPDFRP